MRNKMRWLFCFNLVMCLCACQNVSVPHNQISNNRYTPEGLPDYEYIYCCPTHIFVHNAKKLVCRRPKGCCPKIKIKKCGAHYERL